MMIFRFDILHAINELLWYKYMITKQKLDELFVYKNGSLFWRKWNKRAGTEIDRGKRQICINRVRYLEHRLIFLMHHGFLPEFVDHKDRAKPNNKIGNLRSVTTAQNSYNSKKPERNTSGTKGVSWRKQEKRWMAKIVYEGKTIYGGFFEKKSDAIRSVKKLRVKYHGEFHCHG